MLFFWKGLLVGLLGWGMISFPVRALADAGTAYTVTPELPRDNAAATSYFKFKVTPGQKRQLRLKIANTGTRAATYTATLKIATTNANGNLDYSQNNFNAALPAQANALFAPNAAQHVLVPAKAARWVSFHFTAPKRQFKGVMLAGFTVRPQQAKNTPKHSGIVATTEYAVALEFYNRRPTAQLVPKLTFEWAKYRLAQAHPQMTLHITNHAASLASQGDLTAQLKTKTGRVVTTFHRQQLLFAPQSSFGLNLDLTQHPLKAGDYRLSGQLRNHGGQVSSFGLPVTVTPQQAQSIEQHRAHFEPRPKFNWQFWTILALLSAILIALLGVGYLLWQRREKSTDEDSREKKLR